MATPRVSIMNERWFVVCNETKNIRWGHTAKQALYKHSKSGNSDDYRIYRATSKVKWCPPTKFAMKDRAYLAIDGNDVLAFNCQIEKVFDTNDKK
jgi:hypothetical protein